jgi:hypothetical protein
MHERWCVSEAALPMSIAFYDWGANQDKIWYLRYVADMASANGRRYFWAYVNALLGKWLSASKLALRGIVLGCYCSWSSNHDLDVIFLSARVVAQADLLTNRRIYILSIQRCQHYGYYISCYLELVCVFLLPASRDFSCACSYLWLSFYELESPGAFDVPYGILYILSCCRRDYCSMIYSWSCA